MRTLKLLHSIHSTMSRPQLNSLTELLSSLDDNVSLRMGCQPTIGVKVIPIRSHCQLHMSHQPPLL